MSLRRFRQLLCLLSLSAAVACGKGSTKADAGDAGGGSPDAGPQDAGPPNPIGLWVDGAFDFSTADLGQSGAPLPTDKCKSGFGAAAFDGQGNLWVVDPDVGPNGGSILEWTATQQLTNCKTATPNITVGLNWGGAHAMAFDTNGTLWLTTGDQGYVYGLSSDQIAQNGSVTVQTVKYTIGLGGGGTNAAATLYAPAGIAFDQKGNMWLGNLWSVVEYTPDQLAKFTAGSLSSYPPTAYLTNEGAYNDASSIGPDYAGPEYQDIAFDSTGDLWVVSLVSTLSSGNQDSIIEFSSAQVGAAATTHVPTPVLTINETAAQGNEGFNFEGVAFDGSGNLWLGTNSSADGLLRFPAGGLADAGTVDGGTVAPDVTLSCPANDDCGFSLAFNPIPGGLPIVP